MRTVAAGLALALICLPLLAAQEADEEKMPGKAAKVDSRFEMVRGLVGDWVQVNGEGETDEDVGITYKLTAGESAVMETLHPGTKMEMVTIYHMDGDDLVMTHYCAMKNQPTMKAETEANGKKLTFACDRVANVESHDEPHMHALTLTFVDADRIDHDWGLFEKGKVTKRVKMSFVRKKEEEKE